MPSRCLTYHSCHGHWLADTDANAVWKFHKVLLCRSVQEFQFNVVTGIRTAGLSSRHRPFHALHSTVGTGTVWRVAWQTGRDLGDGSPHQGPRAKLKHF